MTICRWWFQSGNWKKSKIATESVQKRIMIIHRKRCLFIRENGSQKCMLRIENIGINQVQKYVYSLSVVADNVKYGTGNILEWRNIQNMRIYCKKRIKNFWTAMSIYPPGFHEVLTTEEMTRSTKTQFYWRRLSVLWTVDREEVLTKRPRKLLIYRIRKSQLIFVG